MSVLAKIPKTSIFVPAALNKYPLPDFAHARPRPTQLPSRAIFKMLSFDTKIFVTFFSYDYSGYGASAGKPSEKNLYADIEAAWGALRSRYGVSVSALKSEKKVRLHYFFNFEALLYKKY